MDLKGILMGRVILDVRLCLYFFPSPFYLFAFVEWDLLLSLMEAREAVAFLTVSFTISNTAVNTHLCTKADICMHAVMPDV